VFDLKIDVIHFVVCATKAFMKCLQKLDVIERLGAVTSLEGAGAFRLLDNCSAMDGL
jgi:hypothetical protein